MLKLVLFNLIRNTADAIPYGAKVSIDTATGQGTTVRLSLPYTGAVEQT